MMKDTGFGRRWPLGTIGITLAILGLISGYGHFHFGSLRAAVAYLGGERLLVDQRVRSIGEVTRGYPSAFRYSLMNLTGRPVKILGARMSCSCTAVGSMPDTLPVAESRTIEFELTPSEQQPDGEITGTVRLFTDDPSHHELELAFVAQVVVRH